MKAFRYVLLLCVWLTRVSVVSAQLVDVVPPSFGDVRLEYVPGHRTNGPTEGRLLIYFTDGGTSGAWGSVSTYFPGTTEDPYYHVARTTCRMLGYLDAKSSVATAQNDNTNANRIWLLNVTCPEYATNIVQCSYAVYNDESAVKISHDSDYYVTCLDKQSEPDFWHGQVRLCKPDQVPDSDFTATNPIQQISLGVMQIYSLPEPGHTWRSINDDSRDPILIDLETHEADTFCRQIGYSHAVLDSALHVSAVSDFTFTTCSSDTPESRKASQIDCKTKVALPCFTCCVKDLERCGTECDHRNDIVLRCMSDVFTRAFPTTGNQSMCEETSSKKHCESKDSGSSKLVKTFSPIVTALLLTVVGLVIVVVWLGRIVYRRRGYQPLPQPPENAEPPAGAPMDP